MAVSTCLIVRCQAAIQNITCDLHTPNVYEKLKSLNLYWVIFFQYDLKIENDFMNIVWINGRINQIV